ncbi:DNA polymerase [Priestia megaterium]|uniref:DNA polymerase n=1 Tax=Priestia megaterium TaxID=1404 RepID=UPI0023DB823C|nr:DNA polymerase [Priestia megaterium]MDF2010247.1 DNA polymerase [Priestia megaterium]
MEQKELKINIQFEEDAKQKKQRIREAEKRVSAQKKEPSWQEVWFTGYPTSTGKHKKGIFQTKLTPRDKERLQEVLDATDTGEIPIGVESLKKYTKTHALNMYKKLQLIRRDETINKLMANMPENYLLINTEEAFEKLVADLWKEKEIAVDTETTGLHYFETYQHEGSVIVGISISLPIADYHVYIPFGHTSKGKQLPMQYVLDGLKPVLEDEQILKIMFNAKFDIHMFIRHGIRVGGFHFDGFVGMKLLNEQEEAYSLKGLSTKYGRFFGFEDKSQSYEELFGKGGYEGAEFERDGKPWIGTYYPCKDTHLTYRFYKDFVSKHFDRLPRIKRLYYEIEKPILEVCVDMEQNGFLLDTTFAKEYANDLELEIAVVKKELEGYFGDININSNVQLGKVLYEDMNLPDVSGKRKVDAKTLKKLAKHHKGVKVLLKYRDLNKLLTTYITPLPLKVSKEDHRLHGTFNQVDTATGRFASKEPNLQNLPYNARKIIIAPEGKVIIGIDYSQIEPRVLAHISGDEDLRDAYRSGKDLYVEMSMKVFKLERKYCVDGAYSPDGSFQPRKRIKSIFLGIMYGMGSFTLSESIQDSVEVAEQLIQDFYDSYPAVKKFVEDTHALAEEQQFVETMFGRKRRFPNHKPVAVRYKKVEAKIKKMLGYVPTNIWDSPLPYKTKKAFWDVAKEYHDVNRRSVNTRIQGTAADIMKMAMVAVSKVCKQHGYKILATVHDEILFEVPEDITEEAVKELEDAMIGVVQLDVPIKCDTDFMYRWGEIVSKKDWFAGERPNK